MTHDELTALAADLRLTYPLESKRKDALLARGYIALAAQLEATERNGAKLIRRIISLCEHAKEIVVCKLCGAEVGFDIVKLHFHCGSCGHVDDNAAVVTHQPAASRGEVVPAPQEEHLQARADTWLAKSILARPNDESVNQPPIERAVRRIVGSCSDPRSTLVEFIMSLAVQSEPEEVVPACPQCQCRFHEANVMPPAGDISTWYCICCEQSFSEPAYWQRVNRPTKETT